jgi:hypothetical protein
MGMVTRFDVYLVVLDPLEAMKSKKRALVWLYRLMK